MHLISISLLLASAALLSHRMPLERHRRGQTELPRRQAALTDAAIALLCAAALWISTTNDGWLLGSVIWISELGLIFLVVALSRGLSCKTHRKRGRSF